VEWPLDGEPVLSKRDIANPALKDAERHF